MIVGVDEEIENWVASLLSEGDLVVLDGPRDDRPGRGLSIYLFDLRSARPLNGVAPRPLAFRARYLVTAWSKEPKEAHGLLSRVLESALDESSYEVELEVDHPPPWTAFGCRPRPYFFLSALASRSRPARPVRAVEHPLRVVLEPFTNQKD